MHTTLYSVTVPVFITKLTALKGVLQKGEAHATAQGSDPAAYLTKQLAPDMFPLARQVQLACDTARLMSYRLTATEAPAVPDTETTFAELYARVDMTIEALKSVSEDTLNAAEEATVVVKWFPGAHFTGFGYVTRYVIPNFYFHVTTAYAILRAQGVEIGKADYLGNLPLIAD